MTSKWDNSMHFFFVIHSLNADYCCQSLKKKKSSYALNGCCFVIRFAWENFHCFDTICTVSYLFVPTVVCKLRAFINHNYTACYLIIFNYICTVSPNHFRFHQVIAFIHSIYYYPFVVVFSCFHSLLFFYFYCFECIVCVFVFSLVYRNMVWFVIHTLYTIKKTKLGILVFTLNKRVYIFSFSFTIDVLRKNKRRTWRTQRVSHSILCLLFVCVCKGNEKK